MSEELTLHTSNQTPIEIALGIDSQGRTTAKRLYEFLELDSSHYSRWCKANIINNKFAAENEDYWRLDMDVEFNRKGSFAINGERINARSPKMSNEKYQPNPTTDYKLTASFAKKLAMASGSPRGEEARNYFLRTEDALKQVAIQKTDELDQLKIQTFNLVAANAALEQKLLQLEQRQTEIEEKLSHGFSDNERTAMAECFARLGQMLAATPEPVGKKKKSKAPAYDPPLTDDQLECVRRAIRRTTDYRMKQLDEKQLVLSNARICASQMIRLDIHKAIREQVGVRHTQARQSQYREILWVADHHKISDRLIQRIYARTNPIRE